MRKNHIALILLVSLFQTGCAQTTSDESEKIESDWKILNEESFEIHYPSDWTVDKSRQMGLSLVLFSPLSDKEDDFKENVNLMIQDLKAQKMSLDEYTELSENQIKTLATDSEILLSERVSRNGQDYQRVIYTAKQGVYNLQFEQFYWVIENDAHVLTFTAEQDQFTDYQKIGERILTSYEPKH